MIKFIKWLEERKKIEEASTSTVNVAVFPRRAGNIVRRNSSKIDPILNGDNKDENEKERQ